MNYIIKFLNKFEKKEYVVKNNYSLENIKYVLHKLGNPQDKIKNVIHIAGTNGKGSVASYIARILLNHGYKVGLYTSPHIFNVNERISINDEPISNKDLNKYLEKIYNISLNLGNTKRLTYFEILTCVMFLYFNEQNNDFNVLEVGLGGKLDATNVVRKTIISVITKIDLDHTEILGNSIREITLDKSQIIKPNSFCVVSKNFNQVNKIIESVCKKNSVKLKFFGKDFNIKNVEYNFEKKFLRFDYYGNKKIKGVKLNIMYPAQVENASTAIAIAETLIELGKIKKISIKKVLTAMLLKLPSRFEIVNISSKIMKVKNSKYKNKIYKLFNKKMELIFDGTHNPSGFKNFVKLINRSPYKNIILCFTMMKEKDYKSSIKILSKIKNKINKVLVYKIGSYRCQNEKILYNEFNKYFIKNVLKFNNIKNLLNFLINFSKNNSHTVIFTGSLYAQKELFEK